jgi:FkbM family methyltransferase
MADAGATVYAFEPNPWAYEALLASLGGRPNVHTYPSAVGAEAGTSRLYLHHLHDDDPVVWSVGASLFASKSNVAGDGIEVEVVSLPAFLAGLGTPVDLLKLDIEGSEFGVLEALHRAGALGSIACVLVEMHDGIGDLDGSGTRVRELVAAGYPNVRLDWS